MSRAATKLELCPFCGSDAVQVMWNLTAWVVVCPCSARGPYSTDENEAGTLWNLRSATPEQPR